MYSHNGDDREKSYRQMCDEIAWRQGVIVRAEGDSVYIDTNDGSTLLCRPMRPNKFWYETWLALKYKNPISN